MGDLTTLAQVAAACRMDAEAVTERLATDSDATAVREEIDQAVRLGVSGVPFFIFGSKFAVPGAQDSDVLIAAIDEALRDSTPSVRSA